MDELPISPPLVGARVLMLHVACALRGGGWIGRKPQIELEFCGGVRLWSAPPCQPAVTFEWCCPSPSATHPFPTGYNFVLISRHSATWTHQLPLLLLPRPLEEPTTAHLEPAPTPQPWGLKFLHALLPLLTDRLSPPPIKGHYPGPRGPYLVPPLGLSVRQSNGPLTL